MNIKSLKLFHHLAQSKNFSKTAVANHITPSTLTRTIQGLENTIKQSLFIRSNKAVELTAAGKELFSVAENIITEWEGYLDGISNGERKLHGSLKLFCSVTASYSHLPKIINHFTNNHSGVDVSLITGDPEAGINQVIQHDCDVALIAKPLNLPAHIHYVKIDTIPLVLISPKLQPAINEHSMLNQPIILQNSGFIREHLENWLIKQRQEPDIYAEVAGNEAVVSMVALGCGIAVVPEVVVSKSPVKENIHTVAQTLIPAAELGFCCKAARADEKIVNAFLTESTAVFNQ